MLMKQIDKIMKKRYAFKNIILKPVDYFSSIKEFVIILEKRNFTMQNKLEQWPDIIQEIKNKKYMNLYQQIKSSDAIVKDNEIVEIIIYDPKPINIAFLNKQLHIDVLISELSKSLKKEIKLKYKFVSKIIFLDDYRSK